jgi:hypothetical protein
VRSIQHSEWQKVSPETVNADLARADEGDSVKQMFAF